MRSLAALALALAFAAMSVAAAGCGEAEIESPEPPEPAFLTPAEVQQRVNAKAGTRLLRRTGPADAAWEQLGPGLDPPPELVRDYGIFVVYVVKEGRDEAVDSLLQPVEGGPQDPERDIFWVEDSHSGTWVAHKRYGPNVVVTWFSNFGEPATDERFDRLDAALSGIRTG